MLKFQESINLCNWSQKSVLFLMVRIDSHKGRKKSEAHRKALSEAAKKRKASEETRGKMSKIFMGENNPSFGKKWWNNGVENKLCKECPGENYTLGFLNKHWMNKHK